MDKQLYDLHMRLQRLYYDMSDYIDRDGTAPVAAEIALKMISAADDVLIEEFHREYNQ